ncbi:MAG: thioesterase [Acidobacteria bacterium]|nr:MAG: thioesterase [Acidobacteriota bacterium]
MGVVYHTNFLVYFEIGRTDYFRQFGWTYRQMESDDVFMPVIECHCHYYVPARYDDELDVVTRLEMTSRLKLKFSYEVFRKGDEKLIAEGYTIHVSINSTGKPCKIPAVYLEALKQGTSE